jgi:hypothetical protein
MYALIFVWCQYNHVSYHKELSYCTSRASTVPYSVNLETTFHKAILNLSYVSIFLLRVVLQLIFN